MRIAVFDYRVTPSNPIGGCHRHMMAALCDEHDFVVFAPEFDNPRPDRIRHIPIKVPLRPLALLFVAFHLRVNSVWRQYRRRGGPPADFVQGVESNRLGADVVYSQFCHRAYLRSSGGFSFSMLLVYRAFLRWLDHRLHAWAEPSVYLAAKHVVVPSAGLARELQQQFPVLVGKVSVIPNPIDVEALRRPPNFERASLRRQFGFTSDDIVLVFTALGHFERKGLPLVMEAVAGVNQPNLKVLVVGGEASLIKNYTRRAVSLGIGNQVVFVGRQTEVRKFLWLADAFVFPSAYETFSLSTYEAAGSGLPLIVTRLHGVEDFARNRENAFVIDRSVPAVKSAISEFLALSPERRIGMGQRAQDGVASFTVANFVSAWRSFYQNISLKSTCHR